MTANGSQGADLRALLEKATAKLQVVNRDLKQLQDRRHEPVAIVGLGCRFPGKSSTPEAFWRLLAAGEDAMVGTGPRWELVGMRPQQPPPPATQWAALIDDVDAFDPEFFAISRREANRLDPQQRLLLEVAWETLERAGYTPENLPNSKTGVYIGQSLHDYEHHMLGGRRHIDAHAYMGTYPPFASGRLSYFLNLQGPCLTLDTACSSSLVAVHLACQSLRAGEIDLAFAGGVSLILSPVVAEMVAEAHALAPDGRCKTFDARANGFARGEGCGVLLLKRLSDAVRDRDTIWAVIRGTAVNQDGASSGLTSPNGAAQVDLLRQALADARITPEDLSYVEAHGTGTSLGDPIEVEALVKVLGAPRTDGATLAVGSVKTNVGHLEAAAGMAGLFKVILALQHETIPKHLNFKALNPLIRLQNTPLVIPTQAMPWKRSSTPRQAGVSGFAMSGTNAHAILEEAPNTDVPETTAAKAQAHLLPLSARTPEALRQLATRYATFLETAPSGTHDCAAIAHTAGVRRVHHAHRLTVVGSDANAWIDGLRAHAAGEQHPGVVRGTAESLGRRRPVAFVFPGQGSQWLGMAQGLLSEPAFAAALQACDVAVANVTGWSVTTELTASAANSRLAQIDVVQPVLFSVQVALASLWRAWGIVPDAVIGHSMGEVAAAHVAGALSLEDAAQVICQRSRLMKEVSGQGAMLATDLTPEAAERIVAQSDGSLCIAVHNGPRALVLAGDTASIEALQAQLTGEGTFCSRVRTDVAFHSKHMDGLCERLRAGLAQLTPRSPSVPVFSTLLGGPLGDVVQDAGFWVDNLRQVVRFDNATCAMIEAGYTTWLEISAHPVLTPVLQASGIPQAVAVGSLRRDADARSSLLLSLGALYAAGVAVPFQKQHTGNPTVQPVPTYPWQHERFWVEDKATDTASEALPLASASGHPLLGPGLSAAVPAGARYWQQGLRLANLPALRDHRVSGATVLPATAYVEMLLAATRETFADAADLVDVVLHEMLVLPDSGDILVQVAMTQATAHGARLRISSRQGDKWVLHAEAAVKVRPQPQVSPATLTEPPANSVTADTLYARMAALDLHYGPAFRRIEQAWRTPTAAWGRLGDTPAAAGYLVDPTILDAALHPALLALPDDAGAQAPWLPVAMHSVRVVGDTTRSRYSVLQTIPGEAQTGTWRGNVQLLDADGAVLATVEGLTLRQLRTAKQAPLDTSVPILRQQWQRLPALQTTSVSATSLSYVIVGDATLGLGLALQRVLAAQGHEVSLLQPGHDLAQRLRTSCDGSKPPQGVVLLTALDAPTDLQKDQALDHARQVTCDAALNLIQVLNRQTWRDMPRVWFVTAGAVCLPSEQGGLALGQTPLWGLARTLAYEHPSLRCTRVDVRLSGGPLPVEGAAHALASELIASVDEDEIVIRGEERHGGRLLQEPLTDAATAERRVPAGDRPFALRVETPGTLEALKLVPQPRRPLGPDEVEIAPAAVGLNFLDVLAALGALPRHLTPGGAMLLGCECAGTITALGANVRDLHIGQEVIAFGPGALASHVVVAAHGVVPRPSSISASAAATLPVVFLTALYALRDVARLQRGERILIHSAAGGVGLAALQWAQHVGAEIFVTVGTEEKRAFMKTLGVQHIADSRSLSFADDIRTFTCGEGVDVVLNALAGEAIPASLDLLRDHGRFIEIGKRDAVDNAALGLRPFLRNLTFSLVDILGLSRQRPQQIHALLESVMEGVSSGFLKPLPCQTFPMADLQEAFRSMSRGRHIGKIVLTQGNAADTPITVSAEQTLCRPDASYLVTGGLGGLGLAHARGLIERGARQLVLVSRKAPTEQQEAALAAMRALGASVLTAQVDVSDATQMQALFERLNREVPPLAGVVHSAAVLDDGLAVDQSPERFARVFAPKVAGAWNLHRLTTNLHLDFFVMYSSVASLLGSPAQSGYAAANAFLDGLAQHRRSQGLPATSLNWGPFSEVGLAARESERGGRLATRGMRSMTPREGFATFARLALTDCVQAAPAWLDVRQWIQSYPHLSTSARFADLSRAASQSGEATQSTDLVTQLRDAPADKRLTMMETLLRKELGTVLQTAPHKLQRDAAFKTQGVDSLMALEFRNRLEQTLGVRLAATLTYAYPTFPQLAVHLLEKLALSAATLTAAAPIPTQDNAPDAAAPAREAMAALSETDLVAKLQLQLNRRKNR